MKTANIELTKKDIKTITNFMNDKTPTSRDSNLVYTAKFGDGYEVDLKFCPSDDGNPWAEFVMFYYGFEVSCSDCLDLDEIWDGMEFYEDDETYYVGVMEAVE